MEVERIVSRDPEVVSGELVFAGTGVPVRRLVDYLKTGRSIERFLADFPEVGRAQAEGYLEMTLEGADLLRVSRPSETGPAEAPEERWLAAARSGGAFDFLDDPAEDIYSAEEGRPFADEG